MNRSIKPEKSCPMNKDKYIENLFETARNEAPKVSVQEMKLSFVSAIGGTSAGWWTSISLKSKIIMISLLCSIGITAGILVGLNNKSAENTSNSSQKIIEFTQNQINMDVSVQDDSIHEIIYDDAENVVNESKKAKSSAQNLSLKPESLKSIQLHELPKIITQNSEEHQKLKEELNSLVDTLSKREFFFSEKTTLKEIQAVEKLAQAAGLNFEYDVKIRRDKIKRLKIKMESNGKKWMSKIVGTDSFSFNFGWHEDKEGKFVEFICDKDLTMDCCH